jgi:hypothetical protein
MQKSRMLFVAVMVVILAASVVAQDQPKQPLSPAGTATVTFADGKTLTIAYSRPSMRGRKIFGDLVPYGQIWRTGANSATSLKTDVDLTIGGAGVPAGSYTLYSIPGESGWKLVINKQTGQWGTDYDEKQDLARVDMKVANNATPTEQFTISLDKTGASSATLKLDWASTSASVAVAEKK